MRATTACLAVLISGWCSSPARADELTPEKRADIRKLTEMTGAGKMAVQFADAMGQSTARTLKAARPDVPERVFAVINDELLALIQERMDTPGGLIDRVIPIYDRYFTHAEIKDLLAFYQTATGRKIVGVMPKVVSESFAAGQDWGKSLAPEIQRRVLATLKREGIEVPAGDGPPERERP